MNETYYIVEFSMADADDWFRDSPRTFGVLEGAVAQTKNRVPGFDFRVVKVVTTEEVVYVHPKS